MASWLEWFRALYPVIVTLISLAGLGAFLWLASKFVTKAEYEKANASSGSKVVTLEARGNDHETRIKLLEEHIESSPTRQELHDEVQALARQISGMDSRLDGITSQLKTTNSYLHTLIDKALPSAGRSAR